MLFSLRLVVHLQKKQKKQKKNRRYFRELYSTIYLSSQLTNFAQPNAAKPYEYADA
jgi:steroid 5-alpha reductase family enzyme